MAFLCRFATPPLERGALFEVMPGRFLGYPDKNMQAKGLVGDETLSRRAVSPSSWLLMGVLSLACTLPVAVAAPLKVETVASGLEHPWGLAFIGDGRMLVTERPGRMRVVAADGTLGPPLAGLPKVDAEYLQQLCAEQLITRRDRNGFAHREWQKMRERNEALDCYVYARAAASAAGLDRFEERHWRELERQLGMERPPDEPPSIQTFDPDEATQRGGLSASATPTRRRVIRSRWLT